MGDDFEIFDYGRGGSMGMDAAGAAIYSLCRSCNNKIAAEDEREGNVTMLQSTDCFHMIHRKCFVKKVFE